MGLGLVPCGIQCLSLASSQSCSIPSFNRLRCPALPHQTPRPAQQIQHPWCGQLFPTQRPPKIQFAFPCHQPAIFTAGEEAAVEEGGSMARQSRAEPSRRDAPSTCRATCQFDGGRTASGSSRQTAVRKGGNSAPEIMVEKEPPHLEPRTMG